MVTFNKGKGEAMFSSVVSVQFILPLGSILASIFATIWLELFAGVYPS